MKQASMKKIKGLMDGEILHIIRGVGVDKRSVGTTKTAIIPQLPLNIKEGQNMTPVVMNN